MKHILAIITTLTISWTVFFISGSEAFASGLVTTKPGSSTHINDFVPTSSGSNGLYSLAEYLNFEKNLGYFSSTGNTAIDNSLRSSEEIKSRYLTPIKDFVQKFGLSEDEISTFTSYIVLDNFNASMASDFNLNLDDATEIYNYYHFAFQCLHSYLGIDSYDLYDILIDFRSETPKELPVILENGDIKAPSQDFVNYINYNTTALTTSLPTTLVSWKHNPLAVSGYDKVRTDNHFAVMVAGKWFNQSKDLYAMPYVNMNGVTYYGDSVYHFHYGDFEYNYYVSSAAGVTGSKTVTDYPVIDKYSSLSISSELTDTLYPMVSTDSIYEKSWDSVYIVPNGVDAGIGSFMAGDKEFYISGLQSTNQTLYNYFKNTDSNSFGGSSLPLFNDFYNASNSGDKSSFSTFPNFSNGMTACSVDDVSYDYGFLVCSKRFEIGTLNSYLDGSRIPQNSYVTISGDSIYDYSITNGDTGDTTNMGDFINNGYAWLNTGSGTQVNPGGNSGGGTGGNVTVGGDVNVSGKVDIGGSVDINVNVNGGGNGGGNGNSYDFDTDPMDDVLSDALSESAGIRQFLKSFFGFLPPQVLYLLGLLIVAVIFKVIFSPR